MGEDISLYWIRNMLFSFICNILIPKDRQIIVTEPGMKIIKYNGEEKNVFVHDSHNKAIEYSDNQKPIIVDKGQDVLIPADDEIGFVVPKSYLIDSTNSIHFHEIEEIINKWAEDNGKKIEWKVESKDIYLATYPDATIKYVMDVIPPPYSDSPGIHFEYWIKRILPDCAYVIVKGDDPDKHEFGVIITKNKKIIWVNEVNPTQYNILGIVRF